MATAAHEMSGNEKIPGGQPRLIPVIADGGKDVRIILVHLPASPAVGDRFIFDGTTWEIVHAKDHARGCVARPLPRIVS